MFMLLWIAAGFLAIVFITTGLFKLSQSQDELYAAGQEWIYDFPAWSVKLLGALELLAVAGLIIPPAAGFAPVLAPVSAVGIVLMMVGASIVHLRRGEWVMIGVNGWLAVVALFVAWGRFGPYAF